jgi:hypothetical protein
MCDRFFHYRYEFRHDGSVFGRERTVQERLLPAVIRYSMWLGCHQVLNVAGVPPCQTAETVWNYILTSSSVKKNKITLDSEFVKKQLNFWGSKSFSESSHLLSYQIWLVNARSEGVHCTYGQNSRNMYYGNKQG